MKEKNVTLGKKCFHNPLKTQNFKFVTVEDGSNILQNHPGIFKVLPKIIKVILSPL